MTPRDQALLAYFQSRRAAQRLPSEDELAAFERDYDAEIEAVKREMAPVRACMERVK